MPTPRSQPESADRAIILDGQTVAYTLTRSRRRTIGLAIDHRGLRVGAPTAARLSEIESLLIQHARWVLNKLADWAERPAAVPLAVDHGASLPWLGATLQLQVLPTAAPRSRSSWSANGDVLTLAVPVGKPPQPLLVQALKLRAREVLAERLQLGAAICGVLVPPLGLSSARTRWGSCSASGHIRLNWRLALMPLPVIDYVVAHELAHLKEMNHSPRFWSEVERLCPAWRLRRNELRALARTLPNL